MSPPSTRTITLKKRTVALTRDAGHTMIARVKHDPAFARALFDEALTLIWAGESQAARALLRLLKRP